MKRIHCVLGPPSLLLSVGNWMSHPSAIYGSLAQGSSTQIRLLPQACGNSLAPSSGLWDPAPAIRGRSRRIAAWLSVEARSLSSVLSEGVDYH